MSHFSTVIIKHLKKKENIPIHNSIKNNKIFKNEFKEGGEKYKTLMKEIEEDTNKCKGILCHDLKN